jgi:hypothetical protein
MPVTDEERDMVLFAVKEHQEELHKRHIESKNEIIEFQKEKVRKLRKDLVHFQGKFAVVKHENNRLRAAAYRRKQADSVAAQGIGRTLKERKDPSNAQ